MFSFDYDQANETTELYGELNRLRVDDNNLLFFLAHPDERENREKELFQYQVRLDRSIADPATKETFMEAALNYLGRLHTISETLRKYSKNNSGMGDYIAGIITAAPTFFTLGALFDKKLRDSMDQKAREDAYRIITERQRYQQSGSEVAANDVYSKVEQVNSEVTNFFERLKEVEERLNKVGEKSGPEQRSRVTTGKSSRKTVRK